MSKVISNILEVMTRAGRIFRLNRNWIGAAQELMSSFIDSMVTQRDERLQVHVSTCHPCRDSFIVHFDKKFARSNRAARPS